MAGYPQATPPAETLDQLLRIVSVQPESVVRKSGLYMRLCINHEVTADRLAEFTVAVMQGLQGIFDPQHVDLAVEYES